MQAPSDHQPTPLDRVEREHYPGGVLKREVYYRGKKKHGFWREWHPNGVLAAEYFFEDDLYVNCVLKTWDERGKLRSEVTFVNGQQMGRNTVWNEDGSIMTRYYVLERGKVSRAKYEEACKKRPELPRYPDPEEPIVGLRGESPLLKAAMELNERRAASPPAPPQPTDHENAFFEKLLASRNAEALDWLRAASDTSIRHLGEMGADESVEFVERLYTLGAVKVLAVAIYDFHHVGDDESSNHLLVQLPDGPPARAGLFEFENRHAESEGFDGETDHGQGYIYLKLS